MRFKAYRRLDDVYDQVRQGWYGNKEQPGRKYKRKEASCEDCIGHTILEINAWIEERMMHWMVPQDFEPSGTRYDVMLLFQGAMKSMIVSIWM